MTEKVKREVVRDFVEETINKYIETEKKIKKNYDDTDSRMFIKDSIRLRIELLEQLKKDLVFDSEMIWGGENDE